MYLCVLMSRRPLRSTRTDTLFRVTTLFLADAASRARDPRVAQVSVSLAGSWSVIDIVRADGFSARDIRPLVRLNVSVILEENGRRESGVFGMGGRYLYDDTIGRASCRERGCQYV